MKHIAVIGGDGIGPEVVHAALRVVESLSEFEFIPIDAGFEYGERTGQPISDASLETCKQADAVLYGANTNPPGHPYPSLTLLMRKELGLYANIRPAKSYPIKGVRQGIDIVVVRENTEDLYCGEEYEIEDGVIAQRIITRTASDRILTKAFDLAHSEGRDRVTIVHKANVLKKSCGLFRELGFQVAKKYPAIRADEMLIDAMAMDLVRKPQEYNVIVTTNLFGDILSDEASALVGGLGMAPGANIGEQHAMFEPIHGSAPKHAGKNVANPTATILSAKMMLAHLGLRRKADRIENALQAAFQDGKYTRDLGGDLTTTQFAEEVVKRL